VRIGLLVIIVAAGFLLRWCGLSWAQGYHPEGGIRDEIEAYEVALDYAAGDEAFQYLGQPRFHDGRIPGPLWAIFWLTPLRLGGSPETVMLVMILLNTASIPLVYLLSKKLFGPRCSLWAVTLYALSPGPVYHSVGALNVQVMAFLGVLLYLALWDVAQRSESANIFWVCVVPAVMTHFHMIAAFLVPVVVWVIFLAPTIVNRKWLTAGLVVAAALYAPYLYGDATHNWSNTRQMLNFRAPFSFSALKFLLLPIDALSNVIDSSTGATFTDYVAFGNTALGSFYLLALLNAISVILAALFVGGFLREFAQVIRSHWRNPRAAFQSSPQVVFTGLFLCLPFLILTISGAPCFSRYAIVLYPLVFALPSIFLEKLSPTSRWQRLFVRSIAVMIVLNVLLILALFRYQRQLIEQANYFPPSFRKLESVYQTLQADAGAGHRIRIAASDYVHSTRGKLQRGAHILHAYVEMRERFAHSNRDPMTETVYRLRPFTSNRQPDERVVYGANGIMLVAGSSSPSP
jgi:hypothetical protein